ncbi:MAG TPA: hypothetical protein VL961_09115, partial [Acidimicrobiales bacterium]|nr:hypothetical protein [Acidimicrobiales bacterium]
GDLGLAVTFPPQEGPFVEGEVYEDTTRRLHDAALERRVGTASYTVTAATTASVEADGGFRLSTAAESMEASFAFSPAGSAEPPGFDDVLDASRSWWEQYWSGGAAVSFEGSADPRAPELERRVVLSQFLTAVHCRGSTPPQETGLLYNTWDGKFHLEMHWWHAAHFVLWGRGHLLERSLAWYRSVLPVARAAAHRQGYRGVRWPKQIGPGGREAPSIIGPFLVWQQPHPIFYAELLRRASPEPDAVMERYRDLVFASAEFMADFADLREGRFHLGPPVIPAQESYAAARAEVCDPTFELAYWNWGLRVALEWRVHLGLGTDEGWRRVADALAPLPEIDGRYAAAGPEPRTVRDDHPSMLMALGFVPATPLVDAGAMAATLEDVWEQWDFASTWGWDYPVLAMTATKLAQPQRAVDALLMDTPKNQWLPNGHVPQIAGGLSAYLPANGGLLAAVAMMAAGWERGEGATPGFPDGHGWRVRHEGLVPFPPDLAPTVAPHERS